MIEPENHLPGSPGEADYFRRLYESGMSVKEIARKEGYISASSVRKAIVRVGGVLRDTDPTELLRLYENGMILAEIAVRCDMTIPAARQMIVDAGGHIRTLRRQDPIDPHAAWRLYQTGLSLREVGKILGVSGPSVYAQLISAGYKTRTMAQASLMRRRPEDNIDRIIELRRAGMTLNDIGKEIGVSTSTVYKRMRATGVKVGRAKVGRASCKRRRCTDISRVVDLRRSGMTLGQIAEELGASDATVSRRLKEAAARAEGDDGGSRRPG